MALPLSYGSRLQRVSIVGGAGSFKPYVPKVDSRLPDKAKLAAQADALDLPLYQTLDVKSVFIGLAVGVGLWMVLS